MKSIQEKMAKFGSRYTPEQIKNISQGIRGRIDRLGYRYTEEQKQQISKTLTGRKISSEVRKNMSEGARKHGIGKWMKGRPMTEYNKQRLIEKNTGHKYNIGRKLSYETKIKMSIAHKGAKSSFWKGGTTEISKLIRSCVQYKLWRSDIFERDKFTCQDCGASGCQLNADHIKPFSIVLQENSIKTMKQAIACEELWDTNNGRTLCEPCHKQTSTYGNKALNYLTVGI